MAKGRNYINTGLELPPAVSWRMLLPSCVTTSVWQTTYTSAVGLLFPWKKTQQMFCALGVWTAGALAGLSEQTEEGTCKSPRVNILLPKEQGDSEKTEAARGPDHSFSTVQIPCWTAVWFRECRQPQNSISAGPHQPASAWPSRFKSRAALLSQRLSCHRPLSSHIILPLPIKNNIAGSFLARLQVPSLPDPAAPALKLQVLHDVRQLRAVYAVALPP